jgi:hypothetical protein
MEIDFKDVRAVLGEGKDGSIIELVTIIQFELEGSAKPEY